MQYHLEIPERQIDEEIGNCCEFYFDSSTAPQGYYWIFPKRTSVAVGICGSASLWRSARINPREQLDTFVKHHPIASRKLKNGKPNFLQSGMIPTTMLDKLVTRDALILGDAGGFVNPLHKGGIFAARKSAEIASKYAKAFLNSERREQLCGYDSECKFEFHERNYRWDRLIQNAIADDEVFEKLVERAKEKENIRDSLRDLLMFFSHKSIYDSLKIAIAGIISTRYQITAEESSSNLIMIPRDKEFADLSFDVGKTLVAVSYCVKSFECPRGRFSTECDESCGLCDMAQLKRTALDMHFDFRIGTDDDAFVEFIENNEEKYEWLIAISCPYTISRVGYPVHKIFGLKGVVIPLRGDVCTSEDKYIKGVKGEKANQTKTDLHTFFELMDRIRMNAKLANAHIS